MRIRILHYKNLLIYWGKTRDGIKYHINKLQNQGIIKRVGPDKGGYWGNM